MVEFTKDELEVIRVLAVDKRIDIDESISVPDCFDDLGKYSSVLDSILEKVRKM